MIMNKLFRDKMIFYFIGATVLLLSSCKTPFSTRKPEEPKSEQSLWIQPTSPSFVMVNLRNAISEKNVTNYLRCLADTSHSVRIFRFQADPSVANAHPGLFDKWGRELEQNYFSQLLFFLPKDSTSELDLTLLQENTFQDSVVILNDYELDLHYKCNSTDCYRKMAGQVEFRLVRTPEDLWYIYKWSDYATGAAFTWSHLKAYFGK
jgi:hypothetical protein